MSNFVQRTLSGAVYVALVVSSILVHPVYFSVLFGIITMWAVHEAHTLIHSDRFLTWTSTIASGLMFAASAFCLLITTSANEIVIPVLIGVYFLLLFAALVSELFRRAENPIANWGNFWSSQLMIAMPFSLMCWVMYANPKLLLALFVLIWMNDTGAYCVGSLMGKRKRGNHKMFPRVSPGKSWEGLVGGAVVAGATGMLLAYVGCFDKLCTPSVLDFFSHTSLPNIYLLATVFSLIVVVFGTLGDLMESLMKRTIGVKDSGYFLPGHGGVLDRFDSILLATPIVSIFIWILLLI